jgi:D-alanyl-D-alanine carboxypeptidase
MRESNFRNPHGFHADGHVTSARDLAVLARAMLLEMPEYQGYWGIGAVQLGNRVMKNTNGLIGRYPGAEGFKTGFVCASGFNVVATANRGGRTLIAVVMGAASGAERTVKAAQLLDKGFGDWGSSGSTLAALPESGYDSAPNMREDICRRGRSSVVLSDDSENDSAIFVNEAMRAGGMDSVNSAAFFLQQQGRGPGNAAGGVSGGSTSSGRPVLGPRADFAPIPVAFGRAAGSTAVAVGPTRPAFALATPAATPPAPSQPATAFAPANAAPTLPRQAATRAPAATVSAQPGNLPPGMEPARQPVTTIVERAPAAAPAPAPLTQASALRGVEAGEPLQLPGVFTAGSIAAGAAAPRAAGAASLRSRDAARPAERPRLGAIQNQPPARPAATPATPAARTAPKAAARANAPKATAPRVTAPKAAPANGGPRVVRPTAAATPASANPAAARPAAQPGT